MNTNENIKDICPVCGENAKWSAWLDPETGRSVCPKCVSPEDKAYAMERAFPYGMPDKWD